ncbi:MAG: ABC-F family ATP-binding cassette domain-containing protein [Magnetococcales bacterium]|nr:ABC-F family ATP-binding cassette domain-containing protein [Magnetococcales bacterium]
MIHIENLHKNYGHQTILEGASLVVHPGEKVGLVGRNGTGKSTLFRLIEGLEEMDEGEIRLQGRLQMGSLRQELAPSERPILEEVLHGHREMMALRLERESLHEQLESLPADSDHHTALTQRWGEVDHRLEELDSFSAEGRAGAILMGLGFTRAELDRPLSAFSGGWRMRVALAGLLFFGPELLLLDEPTNHLDLESVAWLEGHLSRLPGTVVIISHQRAFLNRVTRITVELEEGVLTRYAAPFDRFLELKAAAIELTEKNADKQARKIAELDRFIRRFRAKATKARQVQSRVKARERIEPIERHRSPKQAPKIRLPKPNPCARETLTAHDLAKSFNGALVFKNASVEMQRGDKVGLLGPNGAGKSTLLKLLASALTPDTGTITLGDRVKSALFTQHAMDSLNLNHTVLASATETARPNTKETDIRTLLGGFLFSGDAVFKEIPVLSGGEKARLALARLFLTGANLLLLDEPTNHLDMEARTALEEALEEYGGTLVLVSHDRDLLEAACTRYLVVSGGRVEALDGSLDDYLERVTSQRGTVGSARSDGSDVSKPDTGSRAKAKENKRLAAQIRNKLHQETKRLRQKADKMEGRIQELEEKKENIDTRLTDPGLYEESQKSHLTELLDQNRIVAQELEQTMNDWEGASMEIEEKEEAARKALEGLEG